MKIVEILGKALPQRGELFARFCKDELGVNLEYEYAEATQDNFEEVLKEVKTRADFIRVGSPFSEEIVPTLDAMTSEIEAIGSCDGLEKEGEHWWPRNFLSKAFYQMMAMNAGKLDLRYSALIVGAGAACRSVFAAVVRAGYTKIAITDKFAERGMETIESLKKKFFNVQTEFVPMQAITTLPGVHNLVINTTPLLVENDLLEELYFFNFLKEGGLVVDLTTVPPMTPLLQEAKTWGSRYLSGDVVAAHADIILMQHLTKVGAQFEKYHPQLKAALDSIPFDWTPFTDRKKK